MEKYIKRMMITASTLIILSLVVGVFCIAFGIYNFVVGNITPGGLSLIFAFFFVYALPILLFTNATLHFPFNDFDDYKMKLSLKEDLYKNYGVIEGDTLTFYVEEKDGVWITKFAEKTLCFNLKYYWFPMAYIKAYLVRQLNYLEIKKSDLGYFYFLDGLELNIPLMANNVKVEFVGGKKSKTKFVVKKMKTQFGLADYFINGCYDSADSFFAVRKTETTRGSKTFVYESDFRRLTEKRLKILKKD